MKYFAYILKKIGSKSCGLGVVLVKPLFLYMETSF